jgi:ABC-type nitrate/sulfonate/bicarbonate transport system substrate-binding protein
MLGALASGNVDAIVAANPDSDIAIMQHHGVLLMNGTTGEYPGLKGMAQLVAVTTRRWAGKNPDLARRVLASIQDGQKAIHDPKQSQIARELVYKKYFNATDKAIFDIAWNHVTPAFPTSPKFSSDQVARNIKYLNTFSEKKYVIEPTQVYTEAYLP